MERLVSGSKLLLLLDLSSQQGLLCLSLSGQSQLWQRHERPRVGTADITWTPFAPLGSRQRPCATLPYNKKVVQLHGALGQ
jgi:hypothetical protein